MFAPVKKKKGGKYELHARFLLATTKLLHFNTKVEILHYLAAIPPIRTLKLVHIFFLKKICLQFFFSFAEREVFKWIWTDHPQDKDIEDEPATKSWSPLQKPTEVTIIKAIHKSTFSILQLLQCPRAGVCLPFTWAVLIKTQLQIKGTPWSNPKEQSYMRSHP